MIVLKRFNLNRLSNRKCGSLKKPSILGDNSCKPVLTWYSCGPTVYDQSHIGHARSYVCTDIIRRILEDYFNYKLDFAMGMTDIDDKIIMKAKELKHSSWFETKKMVEYLEFQFLNDLDKLNVRRPNAILRATDHIPEIVSLIQNIESQGYAYPTKDGIFFNVEKFGDRYGKLCPIPPSRNDSDVESEGVSTDKKFWRDFALWKYQKNSDEQSWPSPWGDGRPGWHIECSAVINSYFGDHIDIHSGGVDLQFPHHTNEIAQSEVHNGCGSGQWVHTWLHMGHLYIAGKKMSKSLKNFISIQEYLNHGYGSNAPATDFRLMCLFHKYHNPISFSSSLLEEGQAFRAKVIHLLNFISTFMKTYHSLNNVPNSNFIYDSDIDSSRKSSFAISKKPTAESKKFQSQMYDIQKDIRNHLCDDINTPQVMRALVNLINNAEQYGNLTLSSLSNNNLRYDKTNVITNSTTIQNQQHPIEPLLDAKDYMLHMISIFGLKINDFAGETFTYDIIQDESKLIQNKNIVSSELNESNILDAFIRFRSRVRNECLAHMKSIKKQSTSKTVDTIENSNEIKQHDVHQVFRKILAMCDDVRDSEMVKLGIKLEDVPSGTSVWSSLLK